MHRVLRRRHRSQALTLCDLYGRVPALNPGEGSLGLELPGTVADDIVGATGPGDKLNGPNNSPSSMHLVQIETRV